MSREFVNNVCAGMPGAEWSDPWGGGHDCWKIGGKIFAVIGTTDEAVSVKTTGAETAELLIETGVAMRAKYLHKSWVAVPLDSAPDELAHRVRVSYKIIRDALPKRVRDELAIPRAD